MFYVYMWLRKNGTPYYIGKGTGKRAYVRHGCGNAPPMDRLVFFIAKNESDAFEMEKLLIWYYGRKDLGTGILRNLTDGGESPPRRTGAKWTEENKKKLRGNTNSLGFKQTEEARKKISLARMGNQNGKCNKGRKRGKPWNYGTARSAEERRLRHREADARYRERQRQT